MIEFFVTAASATASNVIMTIKMPYGLKNENLKKIICGMSYFISVDVFISYHIIHVFQILTQFHYIVIVFS